VILKEIATIILY